MWHFRFDYEVIMEMFSLVGTSEHARRKHSLALHEPYLMRKCRRKVRYSIYVSHSFGNHGTCGLSLMSATHNLEHHERSMNTDLSNS
jgi:hypothetical protein